MHDVHIQCNDVIALHTGKDLMNKFIPSTQTCSLGYTMIVCISQWRALSLIYQVRRLYVYKNVVCLDELISIT